MRPTSKFRTVTMLQEER